MRGGGGESFDKVVVNKQSEVYVRMYVTGGFVLALAIMNDNDILKTRFISHNEDYRIPVSSISNPFHLVINNVWINTETSSSDVSMKQNTDIHVNDRYWLWGTWTSTVEPDNTRVELDCEVVKNSNGIITAKCNSETTWPDSVFNRIPLYINSGGAVYIGSRTAINRVLFGSDSFSKEGFITQPWNGSTRYNVTGSRSNLTIGNQVTIMGLPESFVSYWVNMGAETLMGDSYAMLVPPKSP